jgi:hypothetical protein
MSGLIIYRDGLENNYVHLDLMHFWILKKENELL